MIKRRIDRPIDYEPYNKFTKELSARLSRYPFLKWKTKKTVTLVKKLYKQGYSLEDVINLIILNN